MHDVNWWLMALSFVLGLVLTFAFTVRRVTREVPVYAALGRGPKAGVRAPDVEVKKPDLAAPAVAATAAAGAAAAGVTAAKLVKDQPYGAGSVRVARSVAPPRTEYLVKGDEDTMRYFTVESPDYEKVGAEVWFKDAESAERAGFLRWDVPADSAKLVSGAEAGPYGVGSARAAAGGSGPAGWLIKGNEDSMLYHTPASPQYDVTIAELWFRDAESAERAGFTRWDQGAKGSGGGAAKFADIPPGPYGVGSAKAAAGGSGPEGWLIKGNEDSMLYHTPASPQYDVTIAELWFVDEATAEAAGFKKYK